MKTKQPETRKTLRPKPSGDEHALSAWLEAERHGFYDYLMRMTGQVSRSLDVVEDVLQEFSHEATNPDDPARLRARLYASGRRLLASSWNADTSRLSNLSLDVADDSAKLSDDALREQTAFKALDRSLRGLPGPEREAVILRLRADLEFGEVADVMQLTSEVAERLFLGGMQRVDAECSGLVAGPEETLRRMPAHDVPPRSSHESTNLSVVMQGIKAKPAGLSSPLRLIVLGVLAGLLVGGYFFPEYVHGLWRALWAEP